MLGLLVIYFHSTQGNAKTYPLLGWLLTPQGRSLTTCAGGSLHGAVIPSFVSAFIWLLLSRRWKGDRRPYKKAVCSRTGRHCVIRSVILPKET